MNFTTFRPSDKSDHIKKCGDWQELSLSCYDHGVALNAGQVAWSIFSGIQTLASRPRVAVGVGLASTSNDWPKARRILAERRQAMSAQWVALSQSGGGECHARIFCPRASMVGSQGWITYSRGSITLSKVIDKRCRLSTTYSRGSTTLSKVIDKRVHLSTTYSRESTTLCKVIDK